MVSIPNEVSANTVSGLTPVLGKDLCPGGTDPFGMYHHQPQITLV